ncbi:MAG: alanine--tRNA ligase, partial [Chloroflexi bacterium]|nr:alanine--tRNA ligase [Chloroflexota bacterium]
AYPIVAERREIILGTITREETQFARTLDAGTVHLEEALIPLTSAERQVGRRAEDLPADAPVLPGETAFRLHDTYGFPIDLTVELAAEYGVCVDRLGFDEALAEQRDRSRSGKKADLARKAGRASLYDGIARRVGDSTFRGYETASSEARVVAILRDATEYDELEAKPEIELRAGAAAEAEIVLDGTPFYAEGGGQAGDQGVLRAPGGDRDEPLFTITDTQRPVGALIVHRGLLHGRITVGQTVVAEVDPVRRARTMRNHTGTHLLHRALRNTIGEGARQAGSLVTADYLRFDYAGDRSLTDEEKRAIEAEVRRVIRDDKQVEPRFMTMTEAVAAGADAFFDEKYGEQVRVVSVDGYSRELCGGTHCRATGQIGGFFITGERSIGSGMRRIEAVTGEAAERLVEDRFATLERATAAAGARSPGALPERVAELQSRVKDLEKHIRAGAVAGGPVRPSELISSALSVDGTRFLPYAAAFESMEHLKGYAKDLRSALGDGVIALALESDEPQLFVTVSDDLVQRGVSAGALVQSGAPVIEGRGGGRAEMAQARGRRRDRLPSALEAIRQSLATQLGGEVDPPSPDTAA